jgi:hypothetical protein
MTSFGNIIRWLGAERKDAAGNGLSKNPRPNDTNKDYYATNFCAVAGQEAPDPPHGRTPPVKHLQRPRT